MDWTSALSRFLSLLLVSLDKYYAYNVIETFKQLEKKTNQDEVAIIEVRLNTHSKPPGT